MYSALRSAWIWVATVSLIIFWVPFLGIIRLFDRDPVRYRTGRWFRNLGIAMVKVNPLWRPCFSGEKVENPRKPYVIVSNHQSMADIPMLSFLPGEMKWLAKVELFRLPLVGWLMRMAGDIPVERGDRRKSAQAMIKAARYLEQHCSVIFFPEGTRSQDGLVHAFNDGAFHLAIRGGYDILPVAIEGTGNCLPKKSWIFGRPGDIQIKILPPVETKGYTVEHTETLRREVRGRIIRQIAEWRGVEADAVDALPPERR